MHTIAIDHKQSTHGSELKVEESMMHGVCTKALDMQVLARGTVGRKGSDDEHDGHEDPADGGGGR
jgi:hypothetical protein